MTQPRASRIRSGGIRTSCMAVAAQFFYVAAQAGIFSFFINSMTTDSKSGFSMVPAIPAAWDQAMTNASVSLRHLVESLPVWLGWFIKWMPGWLLSWFETNKNGVLAISDGGAANLASVGFICFLLGRFTGAGLLKKFSAHKILGLYGVMNVLDLPPHLPQPRLGLRGLHLPELLLHVHHVPDHLRPGHLRPWAPAPRRPPPTLSWRSWAGRSCRS